MRQLQCDLLEGAAATRHRHHGFTCLSRFQARCCRPAALTMSQCSHLLTATVKFMYPCRHSCEQAPDHTRMPMPCTCTWALGSCLSSDILMCASCMRGRVFGPGARTKAPACMAVPQHNVCQEDPAETSLVIALSEYRDIRPVSCKHAGPVPPSSWNTVQIERPTRAWKAGGTRWVYLTPFCATSLRCMTLCTSRLAAESTSHSNPPWKLVRPRTCGRVLHVRVHSNAGTSGYKASVLCLFWWTTLA